MKAKRSSAISAVGANRATIRTTFMDVLKELTNLTKDDALVLAVFKRIFASHRVRLARTLAPVKLVEDKGSTRRARRTGFGRTKAWA